MTGGHSKGFDDDDRAPDDDRDGRCTGDGEGLAPWERGDASVVDMAALLALGDSQVRPEALALLVPCLCCRWPEPRAFDQDDVFFLPDREQLDVHGLSPADRADLLAFLQATADDLWQAAVRDERLTTSSGLRRALAAAGIPTVEQTPPAEWLEATVLVRRLRQP